MDVGDLRPRQVIDEEYDQVQVLSNSNVQDDSTQATASNQLPILQPTNIARDHPLTL
jgi:hypothetical protein